MQFFLQPQMAWIIPAWKPQILLNYWPCTTNTIYQESEKQKNCLGSNNPRILALLDNLQSLCFLLKRYSIAPENIAPTSEENLDNFYKCTSILWWDIYTSGEFSHHSPRKWIRIRRQHPSELRASTPGSSCCQYKTKSEPCGHSQQPHCQDPCRILWMIVIMKWNIVFWKEEVPWFCSAIRLSSVKYHCWAGKLS